MSSVLNELRNTSCMCTNPHTLPPFSPCTFCRRCESCCYTYMIRHAITLPQALHTINRLLRSQRCCINATALTGVCCWQAVQPWWRQTRCGWLRRGYRCSTWATSLRGGPSTATWGTASPPWSSRRELAACTGRLHQSIVWSIMWYIHSVM